VILTGDQVAGLDGAAADDVFAYAYYSDTWEQIPLQVDEVDATGVYTFENGLLDTNDELVFMAGDLGEQADPLDWLDNPDARSHLRYEIEVSNPLSPTEYGWVYLYRSATLTATHPDYVAWDANTNRVLASDYVLGFDPASHSGIDALEFAGSGVDALDRAKLRINATCWIGPLPITLSLTEEDLPSDPTPAIDGPVRVGGGAVDGSTWAYASIYQSYALFDIDSFTPPDPCTAIEIHWMRLSEDWLNPADTGMTPTVYYDSNTPVGVPIDGIPDGIPTTPANLWTQVSGGLGSLVRVIDISLGGGTLTNYYLDDATLDPNDTGDGQSFGDAGFRVDNPSGQVEVGNRYLILDPALPNLGDRYQQEYANPLVVTAISQTYCIAPAGVQILGPGQSNVGETAIFSATVTTGTLPFTYTWAFGDDGSVAMGRIVSHTFLLTGTFPVTLTVTNACGQSAPAVHTVTVFEPGAVHRIYLPLLMRGYP
jgi:hypothetical protein